MGFDFGVKNAGVVGEEGRERLIQAPRRDMGVDGTVGVGGVIGFDDKGAKGCVGGARVSLVGGVGRGLLIRGAEKAEPMSERVSARHRRRNDGAMVGTWWDGEGGGLLMKAGDWLFRRYASARRSSTMVLSSRIAWIGLNGQ